MISGMQRLDPFISLMGLRCAIIVPGPTRRNRPAGFVFNPVHFWTEG
jgi:hypothetical protein